MRSYFNRFIAICFLVNAFSFPDHLSSANPDIPEDNLSYPVLLKWKDGSGSGFFYNKDDSTYLITAKHVLFKETVVSIPGLLSVPKSLKRKLIIGNKRPEGGYNLVLLGSLTEDEKNDLLRVIPDVNDVSFKEAIEELYRKSMDLQVRSDKLTLRSSIASRFGKGVNEFEIDTKRLLQDKHIHYHSSRDVAYVKLGILKRGTAQQEIALVAGVIKKAGIGIIGVGSANVKLLADVQVGNKVIVFGYPTSITDADPWLDIGLPLLRKGAVAGINEELKAIILDCPVFQGNSGGLAIEIETTSLTKTEFKAIGVITNFVPYQSLWYQNSGYSVVVPMDYVEELFEKETY